MKEKVANQGITQVLRDDASPRGVNYIVSSSAERLTRLCGAGAPFRPLFRLPFHCSLSGVERLP